MNDQLKISLEKEITDYLNMMSAPLSQEYPACITHTIGDDMFIVKYRNRTYNGLCNSKGKLIKKSLRTNSNIYY